MEYQKIIYSRLLIAYVWTLVLHVFPLFIYLSYRNFELVHPWKWILRSALQMLEMKTWFYTLPLHGLIFSLGFLLSKEHSSPPVLSVSRVQAFYNVFSKNCIMKSTIYLLLGIMLPFLYLRISGDSFTYHSSSEPKVVYLNENSFFVVTCGLWTGLYYFIRFDMNSEKQLQFPLIQQVKCLQLRSQMPVVIRESFKLSIVPVFYFFPLYYWMGNWMCSVLQVIMKVHLESTFTSITGIFNIPLFLNAWVISGIYVILIKILLLTMEIHLLEHYSFSLSKSNKANIMLLPHALSQQQVPIIQYLAFYDLYLISTNTKSLRWQIFALSQPGGHPHTWNAVLNESLKVMDNFISQIEYIYEPPAMEKKPAPVPKHIHVRHMTERERQMLLGPVPLSPPCKLRSLADPQEKIQIVEPKSIIDDLRNKLVSYYTDLYNHQFIQFFIAPKPDAKVRFLLSNSQPLIWATQSLAELAAKALTEDQYGIVLKDLPVIINTLLQLKSSLDKTRNIQKKLHKRDFDICMKAALKSSVKRSLYKIAIAYSEYLTDLPLSPDNLHSMWNFVNFREC